MPNLKLAALEDDRPVKLTVELPANVHRDLVTYGKMLNPDGGVPIEPTRLIAPMLRRFMLTDREFLKRRRSKASRGIGVEPSRESA